MNWFDRWFARKSKWAWENRDLLDDSDVLVSATTGSGKRRHSNLISVEEDNSWGDGLRINIKKMIGGYVVSFRTYDRIKDRHDDRHYIITDEQEFERELGKIITLESMKQN